MATVTLSRASGAATTVTVTPESGFYTVGSDAAIVIAAGSTSNATDTATIAAVDDAIHNPSGRTVTVTGVATSSLGVGTLTGAPLTLIDDEDEKGLVLAPSDQLVVTAGSSAPYTAALTSEPTGAVTVEVTSDNADVTVNPASLTFDATDWNATKTVTAEADGDDYADAVSLAHRATGGGYGGVTPLAVAETGGTRVLAVPVTAVTERVYRIGAETVRVRIRPWRAAPCRRRRVRGSAWGTGTRGSWWTCRRSPAFRPGA